ncbi:MAG: hypothetical protein RL164_1794 [Bacteroidota bacterium]|jgi:hypothetical protein
MPNVQLLVGGFIFDISAQVPLQIDEGYLPFLSEGQTTDVKIRCFTGAPKNFVKPDIHYQAQGPEGVLWEVNQGPEKTCILVYNPENLSQLQQIAYWSEKERSWDIYVLLAEGDGINPLAYPLGPLIWYFLSTIEDVLMIHGSAVILDGQTRVFSGFSGVGKSTMAHLWADKRHATIINDDRLILRKEQDAWYVYNTPMFYAAAPQKGKLHTLFFPYHAPANKLELLGGVAALSKLLAHTIHHGHNKAHVQHHMETATLLIGQIPCHKIGVVPTEAVIDYIIATESKHV